VSGQTVQFKAIGSYQRAQDTKPTSTKDVTNQATWLSITVSVATINPTGLATAVASGSTTITATVTAPLGAIVGTATLDFVPSFTSRSLTSLRIVPGKQATSYAGHLTQMMSIGIYNSEPRIQDITTQVHWESSDARIATIDSAGRAMGNESGAATITASAKSRTGAIITASTVLTQQPDSDTTPSRTLTIFDAGEGTGTVVSNPPGINCTAGNNACSAEFARGTTVTLTATPTTHSTFSGWSANCLPNTAPTCTLVVNNNEPVGIIFH
jgi:Big-like domain-containing protein/List-Bact-rpt repeat protein